MYVLLSNFYLQIIKNQCLPETKNPHLTVRISWLGGKDSNLNKQDQNLLSYH